MAFGCFAGHIYSTENGVISKIRQQDVEWQKIAWRDEMGWI